ncbi:hypothetical protein [Malikia spinosa]|uniref:hypothetical protein n=1 Tax=Malikia spinosa TaxID=86180 RepID=UPI001F2E979D|nr:hypothetical protein [Malikia spinosa]
MNVIDMRCRPAYLHDFFGATPGSAANETARWLNRRVGTRGDDAHYARSRTQEGFLARHSEIFKLRAEPPICSTSTAMTIYPLLTFSITMSKDSWMEMQNMQLTKVLYLD